jgi:hypothetical protein
MRVGSRAQQGPWLENAVQLRAVVEMKLMRLGVELGDNADNVASFRRRPHPQHAGNSDIGRW